MKIISTSLDGVILLTLSLHEDSRRYFMETYSKIDMNLPLRYRKKDLFIDTELDEGKPPRMYADTAMLGLIGLNHQVSPEETYHAWYDHIDDESYGLVSDAAAKIGIQSMRFEHFINCVSCGTGMSGDICRLGFPLAISGRI